jgi:hypothetical protein
MKNAFSFRLKTLPTILPYKFLNAIIEKNSFICDRFNSNVSDFHDKHLSCGLIRGHQKFLKALQFENGIRWLELIKESKDPITVGDCDCQILLRHSYDYLGVNDFHYNNWDVGLTFRGDQLDTDTFLRTLECIMACGAKIKYAYGALVRELMAPEVSFLLNIRSDDSTQLELSIVDSIDCYAKISSGSVLPYPFPIMCLPLKLEDAEYAQRELGGNNVKIINDELTFVCIGDTLKSVKLTSKYVKHLLDKGYVNILHK